MSNRIVNSVRFERLVQPQKLTRADRRRIRAHFHCDRIEIRKGVGRWEVALRYDDEPAVLMDLTEIHWQLDQGVIPPATTPQETQV